MNTLKNIYKIPYFLENSKPILYYRYKSVVRDVFFTIFYTNVGINDEFITENTEDLGLYHWLLNVYNNVKESNKKMHFDTNKIVFLMETETGGLFYLGWYDGNISLGLKREGDKFIKPIKIKYNDIKK